MTGNSARSEGNSAKNGRLVSWLLKICASLLVLCLLGALQVSSRLAVLETKVTALERAVKNGTGDRWRKTDHDTYEEKVEERLRHLERIGS